MPRSSHVSAILALLAAGGALQAVVVPGLRAPVPATFTVAVLDSTAAPVELNTAATAIDTASGGGQAVQTPLPDVINLLVKQVNDRLPAGAPVRPSTFSLMKLGDDTGYCAGLQQAILAGDTVSVLIDFSDDSTDQQVSLDGVTGVTCKVKHGDSGTGDGDDLDDFQTETLEFTFTSVSFPASAAAPTTRLAASRSGAPTYSAQALGSGLPTPFNALVSRPGSFLPPYPSVEGVHGLPVAKVLTNAPGPDAKPKAAAGNPNFSFTQVWTGDPGLSLAVANPGTDNVIAGTTVTVGLDSPADLGLAMQFGKARFNEWLLFAENGVFVAETVRFSYGTKQIITTSGRVAKSGAAQ